MEPRKTLIALITITLGVSFVLVVALVSGWRPGSGSESDRASILDQFSEGPKNPTTTSLVSSKRISLLSALPVTAVAPDSRKNAVLYYERDTGRVLSTLLATNNQDLISAHPLANFLDTVWSPNRREVISIFSGSTGKEFRYFNYDSRKSVVFPESVRSVIFSPDGSEAAVFKNTTTGGSISLTTPDGSATKKILDTRIQNLDLYWPAQDFLAFRTSDPSKPNSSLFGLSREGELSELIGDVVDIDAVWSPDGSKMLVSYMQNGKPTLAWQTFPMGKLQNIDITTSASRCAWSRNNTTLVCAVAHDETYPNDDLYAYSLKTNTKTLEFASTTTEKFSNIQQTLLSAQEDHILVLTMDGKLYSIKRLAP